MKIVNLIVIFYLPLLSAQVNYKRSIKTKGRFLSFDQVASVFISLVLFLFSLYVCFDILKNIAEATRKMEIVKQTEERVDALRFDNLKKQQELSYVISDQYVEKEARSRFNYLKPSEKLFVIPDLDTSVSELPSTNNVDYFLAKSPMEEWVEVLIR